MKLARRAALLTAGVSAVVLLTSCATTPSAPSGSPTTSGPPAPGSASASTGPSASDTASASSSPTASVTASARPRKLRPVGEPRAVVTGLEAPWSVVFREGTPLVSERDSGRILEVAEDGGTRVIGNVDGVVAAGEGGLLGLALDDRDRLYVYSTAADGNRVQRFPVTGEAGSLSLGQPKTLIDRLPSGRIHNGGRIAFGPDDLLYVTVGDAGQSSQAQDRDSLAGKILRMTSDGEVPADNPFPDSLVYSLGHRNPQGLTWTDDGTLFASEFGQNTWDELNVITRGANYGWPEVEGIVDDDEYTKPVQQWEPSAASPSGITYAGGSIFIANLRGQVLRAVPVADPTTSTEYYLRDYGRIRDVTVTPDNQLWLVTNTTDGRGDPGPDDDRILAVDLGSA
jgi:glucose/arabinose dehydrogenase